MFKGVSSVSKGHSIPASTALSQSLSDSSSASSQTIVGKNQFET